MPEFKPPKKMRGYFEIGIYKGKSHVNLGTLWRSAYQLGAAGIFTIGERYERQASDVLMTHKHIPFREYEDFGHFQISRPKDCMLVGVEMGGHKLSKASHPTRAIYLLGSEDFGLPASIIAQCNKVISLEHIRVASFNVAVAGSLVMYDRVFNK